uniref:Phosphatidylglycerol--prolipoprotein diacylglyceryl transferase n=1 Tax=Schlesneria paludicola TaxID=360056 RepID=A0A7C4LPB2_9PLAN
MRQVLFRIPWDGLPVGGVRVPVFGAGILLLLWVVFAVWTLAQARRQTGRWVVPDPLSTVLWGAVAAGLLFAPSWGPRFAPEGAPLFGYGAMLLVGLVSAVWLADHRARQAGFSPDIIWDLALWLFLAGIAGARLLYLLQYGAQVYAGKQSLAEIVWASVNLSEGGIVFYGGALAGAAAHFAFCRWRKLSALELADVITPSIFLGMGFGRLGCLLNGCCYGDYCDLPWCLVFPADSVPWQALVHRGFLPPDAPQTPPLHPTQIYSSLDGFVLAGLTLWYTRYRRVPGDVLGLGLLIAPVTRFLIEFVRGDEYGQLGTSLTISQWISLGLLAGGLGLQVYLAQRARGKQASMATTGG